jgi:hypothetical protein
VEQPLLAKGSDKTFVSRQRLRKHVHVATDTHATIEVLLETVCKVVIRKTIRSTESVRKSDSWKVNAVQRGLEPGSH